MRIKLDFINLLLSDFGIVDYTLYHRVASVTAQKLAELREELRATYSNASES